MSCRICMDLCWAKGTLSIRPAFEAALSQSGRRDDILALFESLPFFIRTAAGVSIAHAGASAPLADRAQAARLFDWNHQALRAWAEERLARATVPNCAAATRGSVAKRSYDAMARRYLAVSGPADPRYDDLLRGIFELRVVVVDPTSPGRQQICNAIVLCVSDSP